MTSDAREARLNSLLVECEQLYRQVSPLLSQNVRGQTAQLDAEQKRVTLTAVHYILRNLAEVDEILKAVTLAGNPQPVAGHLYRVYRDELKPSRPQLEGLAVELLGDPDVEIDARQLRPSPDTTPIWNILVSGLDFWNLDNNATFSPEALATTDRLLFSPFFEPDQWMANANQLQPIIGESADQRIPSNVRVRLRELYYSFILGNHLAAVALARTILEYALVDRAARLGINPYLSDPRYPNRIRRLRELVDAASAKLPDLKAPMETIIDAGNQALHPKPKDKLVLLSTALHALALSSIEGVRAVVGKLYLGSA